MDQPSKKPKPILSCVEEEEEEEEREKGGADELLEDCWYFGNLLHTKITRNSPPAPKSYEETYKSIIKLSQQQRIGESGPSTCLMKTPSMPPILEGGGDIGRGKSKKAETTPSHHFEEEIHDEEVEFSMGKLIRQASLKKSVPTIPTNHAANKGVIAARKEEFGNLKLERLRPRRAMSRLKPQKSLSDLQSQELKYLGLQELKIKEEADEGGDDEQGRKSSTTREDDMKAQIKFWARAVASNVRQEC